MRTPEEVKAEIQKLTELEPKIRPFTFFGDNNRNAIQAQIQVLTEKMDYNDIYDMVSEDGDGEWTQHEADSALAARRWLDGDEDETPSSGWEALVIG